MPDLFLVFNHSLGAAQEIDARENLGVANIHGLPEEIRELWSQLPAEAEAIEPVLKPLRDYLSRQASPGDYVLIQGDFGACFLMVGFCQKANLRPVYATTVREAVEQTEPDGTVSLQHRFRHVRFRSYGC